MKPQGIASAVHEGKDFWSVEVFLPNRNRWSRLYTRNNNPWNKDSAAFGVWQFVE